MWKLLAIIALTGLAGLSAENVLLFRDRGPVESLDVEGGPGGRDRAPRPPFTFVKEELGGTAPKVLVRDAGGTTWSVKFGPEVHAETFATRIAWAAGYFTEPSYYVAEGTIEGAKDLSRAAQFIQNGRFRDGRFELRGSNAYRLVPDSRWTLEDKRVDGTRELNGLKLTLMLVSNWDVKPENMAIFDANGQRYFAVTDWGASMGRANDISGRSKWDCSGFAVQSDHFVDEVADGYVTFNYAGKERDLVSHNIRVEDVKWYMARMGKLSDEQIRAALQASGATPEETSCFVPALRKRLNQLAAAAAGGAGGTVIRSRTVTKTTTKTVPQQEKD